MTISRWYRTGVFYSVDVGLFQDSNDDGVGDFRGLIARLDYLARLGITTIWLHPIHPSPRRDGGYDITDYFGVHPRLGEMGDFEMLVHEAGERGIRVILDLVVNHTSDQHPWFQSARSDPHSPYRDWYVWSETEPPDRFEGMVCPGAENETWTWDDVAHAWYRHRFYRFEPDLNTDNPAVREEIQKIAMFWLGLGVSGFRVDAAPFLIEPKTRPGGGPDYSFLHDLREALSWKQGDSVMLAEANVSDDELREYFGQADGTSTRVLMVFAFRLNQAMVAVAPRRATVAVRRAPGAGRGRGAGSSAGSAGTGRGREPRLARRLREARLTGRRPMASGRPWNRAATPSARKTRTPNSTGRSARLAAPPRRSRPPRPARLSRRARTRRGPARQRRRLWCERRGPTRARRVGPGPIPRLRGRPVPPGP